MKSIYQLAKTAACLLSVFYISSCKDLDENAPLNSEAPVKTGQTISEEAYPGEKGMMKKGSLLGTEISYQDINNQAVYQGDIILSPQQLGQDSAKNARSSATGIFKSDMRWPGGVVYYNIASALAGNAQITAAIAEIESKTSIRFVPRILQPNYVTFTTGRGPSSSVGMIGGQQFITLGIGTTKGALLHEIGHTVGLLHEHTRVDRDKTIKINYANIYPGALPNFKTYKAQGVPGLDFKTLDAGSIMMLDSYTSSVNGQPTMTYLNGQPYWIQRSQLAPKDAECINAMYATLYIMQSGKLYGIDKSLPRSALISDMGIMGDAVTSDNGFVYSARDGMIVRYHKITGEAVGLTINMSNVKAMAMYAGSLYAVRDGYLLRINPINGFTTQVGERVWFQTTAMTYINGFLFIVNANNLFRVTPQDGVFVSISDTNYTNVDELTARNGKIWALRGTVMSAIDPMTGKSSEVPIKRLWSPLAQLTSLGSYLYVWDDGVLYRVSPATGDLTTISTTWTDVKQLTANDYLD
jgi:hypothetical protein